MDEVDGSRSRHLSAKMGCCHANPSKRGQKLSRERYIGADRVPIIGSPKFEDIHTSYIKRTNLNVQMDIKRFGRKSNAFSKKLLNAKRHLALWSMYFNFCRVHSKLRMPPAALYAARCAPRVCGSHASLHRAAALSHADSHKAHIGAPAR